MSPFDPKRTSADLILQCASLVRYGACRKRGEAMRRRGKTVKTQRRRTLKRHNTSKNARGRGSPTARGNRCRTAHPRARRGAGAAAATAEVLKLISRSTFDLQTVLDARSHRLFGCARPNVVLCSVVRVNSTRAWRITTIHTNSRNSTKVIPSRQAAGQPSGARRSKAKRFKLSIFLPIQSTRSPKLKSSVAAGLPWRFPYCGKQLQSEH